MPTVPRPLKVFLCHASADKQKVRELYRYLRRRGIKPWFDEVDLVGGQDWQVEIPKALTSSDAIIICLSKNSVDKEGYIQKEIRYALDKALEMPEGRIFLIPVKFEECEVPFSLSRYQWVDLAVEAGYSKMMKALKYRASQLERTTVQLPRKISESEKPAIGQQEPAVDNVVQKTEVQEQIENQERQFVSNGAQENLDVAVDEEVEQVKAEDEDVKANEQQELEYRVVKISGQKNIEPHAVKERSFQKSKPQRWLLDKRRPLLLVVGFLAFVTVLVKFSSFFSSYSSLVPGPGLSLSVTHSPIDNSETSRPISVTLTSTPGATQTRTSIPTKTGMPIKTSQPTVTALPASIVDDHNIPMAFVPQGKFIMGNNNGVPDEMPSGLVDVNAFYIDKYETTNGQFAAFLNEKAANILTNGEKITLHGDLLYYLHIPPRWKDATLNRQDTIFWNGGTKYTAYQYYENNPVEYVTWFGAKAYCEWRGARLPTEAEWEKAARGTDGRAYPWGEDINADFAFFHNGISEYSTTDVGIYEAGKSTYGVYDLAGNVMEWVSSLYLPYPYSATDGREDLDARGNRVLRGSIYSSNDVNIIYSAQRKSLNPGISDAYVGFRCAKSDP
jgi:formylglycine-generating enzyme required for sulfatase activity